MDKKCGLYEDGRGNMISIYNDKKTFEDGRDCFKIQGGSFRTGYTEKMYDAMMKDGYKKVV